METLRLQSLENDGDIHYGKRADGRRDDLASPEEISAALDAYEAALKKSRDDVEPRWKYLRATYFKAEYTGLSDEKKAALYERAMPYAAEAVDLEKKIAGQRAGKSGTAMEPGELGAALLGEKSAAEVFFWSSVTWGQWALVHGKLQAVRLGAASRIRDDSRTTIAIDPMLEDAGGYRVLGRLHAVSPKVLFFTGWVDRENGVRFLRKAVELAPENPINLFFLAEALHENTDRKVEAVEILRKVVALPARPDHLIEDLRVRANANRDLEKWGAR